MRNEPAWWVAKSPTQDIRATAKYLKAQQADLIVLVNGEDGEEDPEYESRDILPGSAAEARIRLTLHRTFGEPDCPGWRLVVETETHRGVVTCYVHLWLWYAHPFKDTE
jgi:hypothetical protein